MANNAGHGLSRDYVWQTFDLAVDSVAVPGFKQHGDMCYSDAGHGGILRRLWQFVEGISAEEVESGASGPEVFPAT